VIEQMRAASEVPFSAGTGAPKLKVPANACDSHMHIYDSRFPVAANATLRPPDAHVEDYRLLQQRIGTTRNVVVTPSTYGTDNRCTLEAMARIGSSARGVAVIDTSVSDAELKRLADLGVRGIRFNLSFGAAATVDMIEPLARRIHALGWHVQLLMPADQLVQIENLLLRLPVPIVFDHFGRIPPASVEHRGFGVILKLLGEGNAWVKLSGAYLRSTVGPPKFSDVSELARAFVRAAPERMLWGSDWPHVVASVGETAMPDDAELLDLLLEWAPDEATRRKILVDNPAALYGF
jgi:D-galactarolactone isomerase